MAIGNLLTSVEVARELGVSIKRVSNFVVENRLKPAKQIGRINLFDRKAVKEFAKKARKSGRPKKSENN